jgi:glycosyltransferase involved in cell wall biosynthesis
MPSPARPSIFVIVPAYNEGCVLAETVSGLLPYGVEVVVVDDGSADPASAQLESLPVHYLRHAVNLGQGAALQTGTQYALSRGAGILVHFDADGQHDPSLIARLIEPILEDRCDVVLASRFLNPNDARLVPWQKRLVLKIGILVSGVLTGVWLSDTHNGFRALSRKAAERIVITENGFAHATEILASIRRAGLRYREAPGATRYTEYSKAKGQSPLNGFNIVIDLLLNRLLR